MTTDFLLGVVNVGGWINVFCDCVEVGGCVEIDGSIG
jgi:hypothetical protein